MYYYNYYYNVNIVYYYNCYYNINIMYYYCYYNCFFYKADAASSGCASDVIDYHT